MMRLLLGSERGKVMDRDNLPGMGMGWFDLQVHIGVPKVDPSLVVVWGYTVTVGYPTEVIKLVIERLRDIHDGLMVSVPEELSETIDSPGGSTGIKLDIERVPLRFVWGKHSHNVAKLSDVVLHL